MSLRFESESSIIAMVFIKSINCYHNKCAMNRRNLKIRLFVYFAGLLVMTVGIAFSVHSNLGVSPVSSIPYTMTCVWGIEMGNATILFHVALVLIQVLLLRKNFRWVNLLQLLVGIVFGKFTTMCNYAVSFLPPSENLAFRVALTLFSTVLVAIGIFFYVPANIMPLAGEGCMNAISQVTKIDFAKIKIAFDCSMVIISLTVCLIFIHSLGSVGVGTIIAAILTGAELDIIERIWGKKRDKFLGGE